MKVICTVWKLVIMTLWSVSVTTSSLGWQQWMQAVFRRLNLSEQVTHCRVNLQINSNLQPSLTFDAGTNVHNVKIASRKNEPPKRCVIK